MALTQNIVLKDQQKPFQIDLLDIVNEAPITPNSGFVTIYSQALVSGVTQNTLKLARTATGVTSGAGFLKYTVGSETPTPITATAGNYVIIWEAKIGSPLTDAIEKETAFLVLSVPRFGIKERELIDGLRIFLRDNKPLMQRVDPQIEHFDDNELFTFLDLAISDINAVTYLTTFTPDTLPNEFRNLAVIGGMIFALMSRGILEYGRDFNYNDNGISVSLNRGSPFFSSGLQLLTGYYNQEKMRLKKLTGIRTLKFVGLKTRKMPISVRRPLSFLPELSKTFAVGNTFGL